MLPHNFMHGRLITSESALYDFTSFTFTSGTTNGRIGPSLSNLRSAYNTSANPWINNSEFFSMSSTGIQEWTVPETASYRIQAVGAAGAHQSSGIGQGGRGARITGTFSLTAGDIVKIAVGQAGRGGPGVNRTNPGGGGGTFVWINDPPNNPLIIAGGGGGVRTNPNGNENGQAGQNAGIARPDNSAQTSLPGQAVGVGHGSWRRSSRYSCAGGGTGWLSPGNCSTRSGQGSSSNEKQNSQSSCGGYGLFGRDLRLIYTRNDGQRMYDYNNSPVNQNEKLYGGYGSCQAGNSNGHTGGFGGGGGGGCTGEGGGGGYTGGGATWSSNYHGGGAGSYNGGSSQTNETGINTNNGYCTITKL